MFSTLKMGALSVALGAGIFAAGCASNKPPQSSLALTTQGVTCTKCEVTWVKMPLYGRPPRGGIAGYTWAKRDICPDCMDAVTSFFNTGKLRHTCKTCGDTMEICDAHPQ